MLLQHNWHLGQTIFNGQFGNSTSYSSCDLQLKYFTNISKYDLSYPWAMSFTLSPKIVWFLGCLMEHCKKSAGTLPEAYWRFINCSEISQEKPINLALWFLQRIKGPTSLGTRFYDCQGCFALQPQPPEPKGQFLIGQGYERTWSNPTTTHIKMSLNGLKGAFLKAYMESAQQIIWPDHDTLPGILSLRNASEILARWGIHLSIL